MQPVKPPTHLFVDLLHRPQFLLQLHPAILEPDFDLPLGQTQGVRNFDPPSPGQVVVEVELFLQLERLEAGVRLPASSTRASVGTWRNERKRNGKILMRLMFFFCAFEKRCNEERS